MPGVEYATVSHKKVTQQQIVRELNVLELYDKLEEIEKNYEQLNEKLCDPELVRDQNLFKKLNKERSSIEELVILFGNYKTLLKEIEDAQKMLIGDIDEEMREYLTQEVENNKNNMIIIEEKTRELLLPKDPLDEKNIIMEIRQGTGGDEAALFAYELFRMYCRFAEKKKWKIELLSMHDTELGGIKEVVFSILGNYVYSNLKFESGVHRVQRVPATEAGGRIHTSTVTVAVLAEAEEFDVEINPVDLRIDTFRSSGAGGQHVNKTDSAIRITHLPTNVVVACQDERSQHQNKEKAMRILRAKLLESLRIEQENLIAAQRKSQVGSGERSEKIRTYNFPQSRITDHRMNLSFYNIETVLAGDLDDIVEKLMEHQRKALIESR